MGSATARPVAQPDDVTGINNRIRHCSISFAYQAVKRYAGFFCFFFVTLLLLNIFLAGFLNSSCLSITITTLITRPYDVPITNKPPWNYYFFPRFPTKKWIIWWDPTAKQRHKHTKINRKEEFHLWRFSWHGRLGRRRIIELTINKSVRVTQ